MRKSVSLSRAVLIAAFVPLSVTGSPLIWINDGGEKIAQEDVRASRHQPSTVNSVWDGVSAHLAAARNEIVALNVVLEAPDAALKDISVSLDSLEGPGRYVLRSRPASGSQLYDWRDRQIELFFVRYLKIEGVSRYHYEHYDERHVPLRFRRPWSGEGIASGGWKDRPDHDKHYPDIAVPIELHPSFAIRRGESQAIWIDVYVPKDAPSGEYHGEIVVRESGRASSRVPVSLTVRPFALPDTPSAKTLLYYSMENVHERYLGNAYPPSELAERARELRDRHFLLAHRHKITLIDDNCSGPPVDAPCAEWLPRLDGTLFSRANGYAGPGEGAGNDAFAIGPFGKWSWRDEDEASMWRHTDAWASWFTTHAPGAEPFLYLIDESLNFAQTERWAHWMAENPGPGRALRSMATLSLDKAHDAVPSLSVVVSTLGVASAQRWEAAAQLYHSPGRELWLYNGMRPASGTFGIEDDGVALRELAWGQYKKEISRWFYWESTYYNDYQSGMGRTDVFSSARTFGKLAKEDPIYGKTGWNYANGEGVLFYPGTDRLFPRSSYELAGPIASLRLKLWRRGIQDVDYLTLAAKVDPKRVREIVERMVPKALWEYGVSDEADPTWVRSDISWPVDPARWHEAIEELAEIIATKNGAPAR